MNKRKQERFANSVLLGCANETQSQALKKKILINHNLRQDIKDVEFLLNNICPRPYIDEFDDSYYYGLRQIEYQVIARQSRSRSVKAFCNFFLVAVCWCLIVFCVVSLLTTPYVSGVSRGHSQFSAEEKRLPDNSLVTLSRNASFSFTHFPFGRWLSIRGDARIQISLDSLRPLRLNTDLGSLRTLGGEMFVQAKPGNFVRIYVLSGIFEIDDNKGARVVHAGENVIFLPTGNVIKITLADEDYDFWYTGRMSFDSGSLGNVLNKLENRYHVVIRAERLPLSEYKFTGVLQKIESVDIILETICSELGLEYYKEGEGIYVLTRPSKV